MTEPDTEDVAKDAKRPKGVTTHITDTQLVVVEFDHGSIPPIALSSGGAKQVASHIASAADSIDNPEEHSRD